MTDRTDDERPNRDRGTEDATDADDELGEPERQERTAQWKSSIEGRVDRNPREREAGRDRRSEQSGPHGDDETPDATETAATAGVAGDETGHEPTRETTDDEDEAHDEDPVPDAETGPRGGLEHDQDRLRDESGSWTEDSGGGDDEDDGDRRQDRDADDASDRRHVHETADPDDEG